MGDFADSRAARRRLFFASAAIYARQVTFIAGPSQIGPDFAKRSSERDCFAPMYGRSRHREEMRKSMQRNGFKDKNGTSGGIAAGGMAAVFAITGLPSNRKAGQDLPSNRGPRGRVLR